MGQKKLIRFAEIATFQHVLQYPENMPGNWQQHFGNAHPLTLELACGKGEYAVGLAQLYKDRNFIGIDVKGNRIWVGAKQVLKEGLENVAFIRSQIGMIENYFAKDEVSEIWIPFADPQLRISKSKKRLTHPVFLRKYKQFLQEGGYIHLKTDSPVLYNFTKLVINMYGLTLFEDIPDISSVVKQNPELLIKTHYEGLNIARSNRIHYLKFAITGNLDIKLDDELARMVRETEKDSTEGVITHEEETD
jgi:tRNA (guanine-N7-)-methyltransferase